MKKLIRPLPAATLPPMKILLSPGLALLALFAGATASARADTRMQVAAGATPIYAQASASGQQVGTATAGEILFVNRVEGDWAAIAPPDRLDLWLNKDFIEGNRVVAKSIQIRSGPGIEFGVVGTLERGAPVMPRGEQGDWCKIAPPSSTILWVKKNDLSEVRTHTTPIEEVATMPEPAKPAPQPVPAPAPVTSEPAPQPELEPEPVVAAAAPAAPVPQPEVQPAPAPAAKVAPSTPGASASVAPKPAPAPAVRPESKPAPVASTAAPAKPVAASRPAPAAPAQATAPAPRPAPTSTRVAAPAAPTLRPATGIPGAAPRPAATNAVALRPAAPASPAAKPPAATQKPKAPEVKVDQAYVDELDLADMPDQGKSVKVEGELRNAPFMAGSPSRYRLQGRDEDGMLEMICHIHGDSEILRDYVGQEVSIQGRQYWVEESDMPVVVVGKITALAPPSDEDEPVVF